MNKIIKLNKNAILAVILAFVFIAATISIARAVVEKHLNTYRGLAEAETGFAMQEYDDDAYFYDKYGLLNYEDEKIKSSQGIDVSEYQGDIDWKSVSEAGVEFAMVRVGYSSYVDGTIQEDGNAEANIYGASDNGISVGVYFFSQATTVDEAIEEAKYVLSVIRHKDITMPVAFDMEPVTEDDRIGSLSMKQKTEIADAFCEIIENHGYKSLIYGNPTWISNNLNLSLITDHELWLAHYTSATGFPYKFAMWQYSQEGRVNGIDTYVDLDIMYVTRRLSAKG